MSASSNQFSVLLINWYHEVKRDLPWRKTRDPYIIWVSEIILQQTRVNQGLEYFNRFISAYPNVFSLANAREQDVLRLWQGLGYYSRARNMLKAAKQVVNEYGGIFPMNFDEIRKLAGVGEYTASAIASFAFDLPYPVIDGNVKRVLSRYFGIDTPLESKETLGLMKQRLDEIFDPARSHDFNQAIMEFGALQCTPSQPDCATCIFNSSCKALLIGKVGELPRKGQKILKKERFLNYFVIRNKKRILIRKRTGNDIWKNMYDFPSHETKAKSEKAELTGIRTDMLRKTGESVWRKHVLTHQVIYARFIEYETSAVSYPDVENSGMVFESDLTSYPLPKLIDNYLKEG